MVLILTSDLKKLIHCIYATTAAKVIFWVKYLDGGLVASCQASNITMIKVSKCKNNFSARVYICFIL